MQEVSIYVYDNIKEGVVQDLSFSKHYTTFA